MTTVFLSPDPINGTQFIPGTAIPAAGAKLFSYIAGSSTKQDTFVDNTGVGKWSNPIILDSGGNLGGSGEVWIPAGVSVKFVLAPFNDTDPPVSPYWTRDNMSGMNDTTLTSTEWIAGPAPTFISTTSFSLVGDQTLIFTVNRRVKTTNTGGTVYSTIVSSVFGVLTTVTVLNDSGVLDVGLSAVFYGLINPSKPSILLSSGAAGISTNLAIGALALASDTTGNQNVAIGQRALTANSTGSFNTAVGVNALQFNTVGQLNTAIGITALQNNTGNSPSGNNNTAVGAACLTSNTGGDNNTAAGYAALNAANSDDNTAFGTNALRRLVAPGKRNTTVGSEAGGGAGSFNAVVAMGYYAASVNVADNTTALGTFALQINTSGASNTGVGAGAAKVNTIGNNITAVGVNAAASTINASDITAIGQQALLLSTGGANTAVGSNAGSNVVTGGNLTLLGANAQPSSSTVNNEITLGDGGIANFRVPGVAFAVSSNVIVMGGINTAVGASTATLTNSPHSGNPTVWPRIVLNGTTFCFPCFLTT